MLYIWYMVYKYMENVRGDIFMEPRCICLPIILICHINNVDQRMNYHNNTKLRNWFTNLSDCIVLCATIPPSELESSSSQSGIILHMRPMHWLVAAPSPAALLLHSERIGRCWCCYCMGGHLSCSFVKAPFGPPNRHTQHTIPHIHTLPVARIIKC